MPNQFTARCARSHQLSRSRLPAEGRAVGVGPRATHGGVRSRLAKVGEGTAVGGQIASAAKLGGCLDRS